MFNKFKTLCAQILIFLILSSVAFGPNLVYAAAPANTSGSYPATNLIVYSSVNSNNGLASTCAAVMSWGSTVPPISKGTNINGATFDDANSKIQYQPVVVGSDGVKVDDFNITNSFHLNTLFSFRTEKVKCGSTYTFKVDTFYVTNVGTIGNGIVTPPKYTIIGEVTKTYTVTLPSSSAGGTTTTACAAQNLTYRLDRTIGDTGGQALVYLAWNPPTAASCSVAKYAVAPGNTTWNTRGSYDQGTLANYYQVNTSQTISTPTLFTVNSYAIVNKVDTLIGSAKINVDPGLAGSSSTISNQNSTTGSGGKDGTGKVTTNSNGTVTGSGSGSASEQCQNLCPKNNWGILNPSGAMEKAICDMQCSLISWEAGFITSIVNNVLIPSFGLDKNSIIKPLPDQ